MILITAASGTIGNNLTYILAHAGAPLRAMVRDKTHIPQPILDLDIDIIEADFEKPETLKAAMTDVTHVFLNAPADRKLIENQANVIDAAKDAGVQAILKLSTIGAAPNAIFSAGRWHFEAEQRLEASGIPYAHLRSHSMMQNFFEYAPFIQTEGAFLAPIGPGKLPLIDARDVATAAAVILTTDGHNGMIYEITGPEAISYYQAAEIFTEVLNKPIRFIDIPLDKAREAMLQGEWPEWMVNDVLSLYQFFREGNAAEVTDTIEKLTERPGVNFSQFVRDYAAIFKNPENQQEQK